MWLSPWIIMCVTDRNHGILIHDRNVIENTTLSFRWTSIASRESYAWCISSALAMGGAVLHVYTYSGPVSGKKFYCIRISQSLDPRTRMLTRLHRFEIWQDLRQRSHWDDYQISERLENCKKTTTRAFEISRYLTIRRIELASAPLKTHLIT